MGDVVITYKQSRRRPRVFKVWDTAELYTAMVMSEEIIHQLSTEDIKEKSIIGSTELLDLALAYSSAYSALMKEGLIKSGNISKISPTIH